MMKLLTIGVLGHFIVSVTRCAKTQNIHFQIDKNKESKKTSE